jgi:AraC-like DNA-binding protein
MIHFSTDDLRPHERFDHWCEVRARNVFGVTISLEPERRLAFSGRLSAWELPGASIAQLNATPYRVHRTWRDVDRLPSQCLCLYQQIGGGGWFETAAPGKRAQQFIVAPGALATSNSDLPYLTAPTTEDGFNLRLIKIPLSGDDQVVQAARDLSPELVAAGHPLAPLLAASFAALARQAEGDDANAQDVRELALLILLARGRITRGTPEARAAVRSGYRHAAMNMIRTSFHRADLTPATLASALGISVRQVHLLFEPTGTTFARMLNVTRMNEAHRLLVASPSRAVADIAFACGFDSLATFYRLFRLAYDTTPTDARRVGAAE